MVIIINSMNLSKIKLVVLDSDGVIVPKGTTIQETETNDKNVIKISANKISDKMADLVNRLKKKYKVAISSGRSLIYLQSMYSKVMGDIIIQAESLLQDKLRLIFYLKPIHF